MRAYLRLAALLVLVTPSAPAEEVYAHLSLRDVPLTEGAMPGPFLPLDERRPYATVDGGGEAHVALSRDNNNSIDAAELAVRLPAAREVTGRLYVPAPEGPGMQILKFKLPPDVFSEARREDFLRARRDFYQSLFERRIPGTAWFRHRAREGIEKTPAEVTEAPFQPGRDRRWSPDSSMEATFDLFSGGKAVSENLQLERLLPPVAPGEVLVDLASIQGISVAELDWKALVKDLKPAADTLAAFIPADQHGIFFPSFTAMTTLLDEADRRGTPILHYVEPRAEDARTRERSERQLLLGMSVVSRILGPQVVKSVAMTGSDPYVRMGSDIAVLFETAERGALESFLKSKHAAALKAEPGARAVSGETGGTPWSGVVSPDRSVSSYLAVIGNTVVVSNSLFQIERIAATGSGKTPSLASLPEYVFFRHRYSKEDAEENALLILSDATIRRWCGPRWRIASSRRARAAAVLSDLQARELERLARHDVKPGVLASALHVPDAGDFILEPSGVRSTTYGTLEFLTPIAELKIEKVTPSEAEMYGRWRDGYQANWRRYFDPIAVRFKAREDRLEGDLTVMPLIAGTEYREFIDLTSKARLGADSGDRHAGTVLHLALAINPESNVLRQAEGFLSSMAPGLRANPLGWLGSSAALWADDDPIWAELLKKGDGDHRSLERSLPRLPIALRLEVKNGLGAAVFLAAVRAFVEQTAPRMTLWESLEHKGQAYVKVSPVRGTTGLPEEVEQIAIHYAVTPSSLVLTLSEDVLKRTLDRQAAQAGGEKPGGDIRPWLGESLCLQADARVWTLFEGAADDRFATRLQELSWDNLPVLNEWKRLLPGEDPVKFHERIWGTRLLCPGGGKYVWNEEWGTMESTVFGSPGSPRMPEHVAGPLEGLRFGNFGLSFEEHGLRGRAVLERAPQGAGGKKRD